MQLLDAVLHILATVLVLVLVLDKYSEIADDFVLEVVHLGELVSQ